VLLAQGLCSRKYFPSTADFRAIVSRGGVPGCDVTLEDVKTTEVIWGCSVLKMKGNTVRKNGKRLVQSIVKVPSELIKLHQDVELAIDIIFVPAVIERVNALGQHEPTILTFTDWQGCDIGERNPHDADPGGVMDDDSVIIYPAVKIPGVDETVNPAEIAGVDPDFIVEPTGVDMDTNVPIEDTAIVVNGLGQEDPTHSAPMAPNDESATSPKKTRSPAMARSPVKETADPRKGMAARNNRV
jgi:hypothetical protein